jgi:hypothetical protein
MTSDVNVALLIRRISDLEIENGRLEGNAETLTQELKRAQEIARGFCRCAQHLAIMHRRENRAMVGAEEQIARLRLLAGPWIELDRWEGRV